MTAVSTTGRTTPRTPGGDSLRPPDAEVQLEQPAGGWGARVARLSPLAVFVVLAVAATVAFAVTRQLVDDQEQRLLEDRGAEVVALLSNAVGGIESSLRLLGAAAAAEPEDAPGATSGARSLVEGGTTAVGVAEQVDGGMVVTASAGTAPAPGGTLDGELLDLAERAVAEDGLVTALVDGGAGTHLAVAVAADGVVAYQETAVDPGSPAPSTPDSPFRELRVAVYAAPRPDPALLVVATEVDVPIPGAVVVSMEVGADEWSVELAAREPLTGSFARFVPWFLLGGGVLTALLASIVVGVLARRRDYALALVAERTTDLRRAREVADAANRSKSEFLSRMSHELRTPLNAILGFGQVLELDDLTAEQRDSVDHIVKGGRHLLELINEVLDLSRIETGSIALSPEAVRVRDLLDDAVDLIRPLADQRGLRLVADTDGCDDFVFADRQRTKQILLNLLSNAVKYNRQRGTVTISCTRSDEGRVRIVVVDTGPGLRPDQLELLFVPFERLGAEQSDVEGTGIGLALSLRLAEAMAGTVAAESTPGKGSTFWVELPRVEGPVERYERLNGDVVTSVDPATEPSSEHMVLHIEDNLSNVKLIERILARRPDVGVIPAMQGRLGLELAHEHRPVLVLLDLHLPDMSGEEVLRHLREDPVTAATPVVIVSADATAGQVQRLLAAGAAGYLTKPIEVRDLLDVLDQTLDRR